MDHRRTAGKFYTPRPVVQYIVRQTFDWLRHEGRADHDLRILEPACGEGIFLLEAHRYLMADASFRGRSPEQVLRSNLYGIDRDPQAVMKTRQVLAAEVAANDQERQQLEISLAQNIRCGDALVDCDFETKSLLPSVVQSLGGGFDAVIGNPPYVNIRLLTQHYGEMVKDYLRQHFRCASGAYDLYVLFFELALRLLRPGGVCGMIVPNKLATLDYARVCRSMLLQETTLLQITDLSRCRVFPHAGVYPYIVIWRKHPPSIEHRISIVQVDSIEGLSTATSTREVLQRELSERQVWHMHGSLDIEGRVMTRPLGELAEVHSGTTGFQAESVANRLREWTADGAAAGFEFVVTGNVDRYAVRSGDVRFMKRRFARPILPDDQDELTNRKRALYRGEKIVVAGMSKRLEAAWDPGGLALGVQLYALVPKIDAYYLLAILNSKLMSYLFRLRFRAKHLAGGYMSVNKSQLTALPIRTFGAEDADGRGWQDELARLAREMTRLSDPCSLGGRSSIDDDGSAKRQAIDQRIDHRVYELYALTDAEIQRVEDQTDE